MANSIELSSGIVVDMDGGRAYVMAPEGGVTAVALQDGTTLWHSNAAEKPLLLSEGLLLSQAVPLAPGEGVAIRMLLVDGGQVTSEGVLPLPGGVDPMIAPTADRGFNLSAESVDGDALLRWEFHERPLRGLATGPDEVLPEEILPGMGPAPRTLGMAPADTEAAPEAASEETVVRGQVRLSLSDGAVRPMVEPFVERSPPTVPQFPTPRQDVAPEARGDEAGPEDPLVFQSADGTHRLRSTPTDDGDDALTAYRWELFETGTSAPVGTVEVPVSFAPFVVTEGRVIVELQPYAHVEGGTLTEEPMQLRAYDLGSGDRLWSTPVRDIYAVPEPPP